MIQRLLIMAWCGLQLLLTPVASVRADDMDAGALPTASSDVGNEGAEEITGREVSVEDADGHPVKATVLAPVTVNGATDRAPGGCDETAVSTDIDEETLQESARANALEVLSQETSGMYVTSRGVLHGVASGASGGIQIRGLGGSPNTQILVVEDGVPDFQGIFGHPIPDAYVPFLLSGARVTKGGDSVLWGSNALGGVIELRRRWPTRDGLDVALDSAYGSFSTVRNTASFLGRWGSLDAAGSFHAMSSQGHRDGAGGDLLVAQGAVRHKLSGGWWWSASEKLIHLEGADPGPVEHPVAGHWFDVWRNNVSLTLVRRSSNWSLRVVPYGNYGRHRLYDGFLSDDFVAGGRGEITWRLQEFLRVRGGVDLQGVDGMVEDRAVGERTEMTGDVTVAAYAQVTWKPVRPLTLVLGGRELYSDRYGLVHLYKVGGGWRFSDWGAFRTRVARNYRQPTLRELYLPYPVANPDLVPETALNWDAGFSGEWGLLSVEVSAFRTQADNMIKYFGSWPSAEVVNIDHMVFWGVEGEFQLRELGPVSLRGAACWQDVGRYTRQNPEAKVNAAVSYDAKGGPHEFHAELSAEWVHGLYMGNYRRDPLDDVWFMDFTMRYRHRTESAMALEPYLTIRNLLDQRTAYVAGYVMPGLNAMMGLKVEF